MEGKDKLKLESVELRFEPWRIEGKILIPLLLLPDSTLHSNKFSDER